MSNVTFIYDIAVHFFKVVRVLNMKSESNMLEDASSFASALASLKSAVLKRYTTPSYWARDRMVQDVSDGRRPPNLLQWINNATECPMILNLPQHLQREFEYENESMLLMEKVDRFLIVDERTSVLQVTESPIFTCHINIRDLRLVPLLSEESIGSMSLCPRLLTTY